VNDPSFGLLGSGEFEPWSEEVDRWLLERATGDGSVVILPTASAPEGDAVFDGWASMGLEHYEGLGLHADVLAVKTREDAERDEAAERVDTASVVFFSGGNPAYLARTLVGTPVWSAVLRGLARGMAYAGCSAGVACLGDLAPDSAERSFDGGGIWQPGLRLFPKAHFGPHWDALDRFVPGLRGYIEASVPSDTALLALDERTALLGDGLEWSVVGAGAVALRTGGRWRTYRAGATFEAPLSPDV
jgi:cyanophycinase